jgi:hypothetical protein
VSIKRNRRRAGATHISFAFISGWIATPQAEPEIPWLHWAFRRAACHAPFAPPAKSAPGQTRSAGRVISCADWYLFRPTLVSSRLVYRQLR